MLRAFLRRAYTQSVDVPQSYLRRKSLESLLQGPALLVLVFLCAVAGQQLAVAAENDAASQAFDYGYTEIHHAQGSVTNFAPAAQAQTQSNIRIQSSYDTAQGTSIGPKVDIQVNGQPVPVNDKEYKTNTEIATPSGEPLDLRVSVQNQQSSPDSPAEAGSSTYSSFSTSTITLQRSGND
jgi:hypothetical protein